MDGAELARTLGAKLGRTEGCKVGLLVEGGAVGTAVVDGVAVGT